MSLGFQRRHPGGMAENSPAFQRWDRGLGVPSPEGTAELVVLSRPFGTQPSIRPHPALKQIFRRGGLLDSAENYLKRKSSLKL